MAECACGLLPVVSRAGRVLGVITESEISSALSRQDVRASQLPVRSIMEVDPETAKRDDELSATLARMARLRLRTLLVADPAGRIEGVLCLDDVVAKTGAGTADAEAAAALAALRSLAEPLRSR